jgi:hypothetical protein
VTTVAPWLGVAGLGVFHGVNPAMGWLFAVALGLHRHSRRIVLLSLAPMALGHALSIWLVATSVLALGTIVDASTLQLAGGALLIAWSAYHWLYGHRHRVRIGMTTGLAGLAAWSFLMATAHGAGLMLVPALIPICSGRPLLGEASMLLALLAVSLHTLATLLVTGVIAVTVYEWIGVGFLRRGWINFDMLWTGMLASAGLLLIVA